MISNELSKLSSKLLLAKSLLLSHIPNLCRDILISNPLLILSIRQHLQLSQSEFATQLGISRTHYSRLESTATPRPSTSSRSLLPSPSLSLSLLFNYLDSDTLLSLIPLTDTQTCDTISLMVEIMEEKEMGLYE